MNAHGTGSYDRAPPDLPSVEVPDSTVVGETVQTDVPCHACGYNLRGLSPDGRCPECGRALDETLIAYDRARAAAAWAREFEPAAAVLAGSIKLAVAPFVAFALAAIPRRQDGPLAVTCALFGMFLASFSAFGVVFGACALECRPTERVLLPDADRIRRRARWASAGFLMSFPLAGIALLVHVALLVVVALTFMICGLVWLHEHARYIGTLAAYWERQQLKRAAESTVLVVRAESIVAAIAVAVALSDPSLSTLSTAMGFTVAGSILPLLMMAILHLRLNADIRSFTAMLREE